MSGRSLSLGQRDLLGQDMGTVPELRARADRFLLLSRDPTAVYRPFGLYRERFRGHLHRRALPG